MDDSAPLTPLDHRETKSAPAVIALNEAAHPNVFGPRPCDGIVKTVVRTVSYNSAGGEEALGLSGLLLCTETNRSTAALRTLSALACHVLYDRFSIPE